MQFPTQPYLHELLVFLLVLVRVASLVFVAPILGSSAVPLRMRGLLALALTILIAPIELAKHTPLSSSLPDYLVRLGAESLIGLTLGLGVLVLFSGVQVAGQLISQMSGIQLADVVSPGFDTSVPVFSQLLLYVTLVVFVTIGGHRQVIEALLDTFNTLPAGQGHFSSSAVQAITALLSQSFELGVRAAPPAMVALLLATLILGLAGRTLPQLNVMALGLGLNTVVTLLVLGISLGASVWIFQEQLGPALTGIRNALHVGQTLITG